MNKDLQIAKKTVKTEIQALKKLSASFSNLSQFSKAVSLCSKTKNKIVEILIGEDAIRKSQLWRTGSQRIQCHPFCSLAICIAFSIFFPLALILHRLRSERDQPLQPVRCRRGRQLQPHRPVAAHLQLRHGEEPASLAPLLLGLLLDHAAVVVDGLAVDTSDNGPAEHV